MKSEVDKGHSSDEFYPVPHLTGRGGECPSPPARTAIETTLDSSRKSHLGSYGSAVEPYP